MKEFKEAYHRIGFWFLVILLIGFGVGGYANYKFNKWQLKQSIQLGGFVHDGEVYNITPR